MIIILSVLFFIYSMVLVIIGALAHERDIVKNLKESRNSRGAGWTANIEGDVNYEYPWREWII